MTNIDRAIVLNALIKPETLTIVDIRKAENPGVIADTVYLNLLLNELVNIGYADARNGVAPITYAITNKGIKEGQQLNKNIEN